jgi:PTH1 family peptidyl-tRNA hydrolase
VGLGNPGPKYANNRHNVGFMVVQRWLERFGTPQASDWRDKFHGRFATASGDFGRCVVLQPLTYMNLSGRSVVAAAGFYRVPNDKLVVVHDEADFEFGRIAVKRGGGHGGHNGLRDILAQLGHGDFVRVRVGVGRPVHRSASRSARELPVGGDVSGWLLSDFTGVDAAELPDVVDRAQQAVTSIMTRGITAAMNEFNQKLSAGDRSP